MMILQETLSDHELLSIRRAALNVQWKWAVVHGGMSGGCRVKCRAR